MNNEYLYISGYECFDLSLSFWIASEMRSNGQLIYDGMLPYYTIYDGGYRRYLTEYLRGENVVVRRVDYLRAAGPVGKLL